MPPDDLTMATRLGVALAVGITLGVNRDLHHKAAGVRTHSLVALGSALAALVTAMEAQDHAASMSRVLQGLLTGIGFLGAGVIIHHEAQKRVQGLTTAASLWVAAILGLAAGSGHLVLVGFTLAAVLFVLILGGPIERACERRFGSTAVSTEDTKPHDAPR